VNATLVTSGPPRGEPGPTEYRSTARTHVGRVRKVNEDRILDRPDRALWAVADGMGGHRGGDIAAELAVAALRDLADDPAPITDDAILAALMRANGDILARGAEAGGVIGSTIVALHIAHGEAHVFWAGDSRAYRAKRGVWEQLTSDHSLVQELLDQGLIDTSDAAHHPRAHVITRALGVDAAVEVECLSFAITADDVILLCSDGLSRSLDPVAPSDPGNRGADQLLADALQKDGSDNISFLVISSNEAAR
jgi:serine/threonine protein phosphatase PrpC